MSKQKSMAGRPSRNIKARKLGENLHLAVRRSGNPPDDPMAPPPPQHGRRDARSSTRSEVPLPPAVVNPTPIVPSPADRLPEDLRDAGPIRRRLDAVRETAGGTTWAFASIEKGLTLLQRLVAKYPYFNSEMPDAKKYAEAYKAVYSRCRREKESAPDPVLVTTLAVRAGDTSVEEVTSDAFHAYRRHQAGYDAVLGDLLPCAFVTWCDEFGFEECQNPTAAAGARAYARRLAARRKATGAGLRTGVRPLDESQHGLRGVTVVSGPPEADPPLFARFLVYSALTENPDLAAVVVPYRTDPDRVMDHLVCMAGDATVAEHQSGAADGTATTLDRLAGGLLGRLVFCLPGAPNQSLASDAVERLLTGYADRLREASGASRVLFLIDGLDMLNLEPAGAVGDAADDQFDLGADAERIRLCRRLSRKYGADRSPDGSVVLAVAKSRKPDPTRRMGAEAVAGSSDVITLADSVLLIEPERVDPGRGGRTFDTVPMSLTVAKADPVGVPCTLPLTFRRRGLRFDGGDRGGDSRTSRGPSRNWGTKS